MIIYFILYLYQFKHTSIIYMLYNSFVWFNPFNWPLFWIIFMIFVLVWIKYFLPSLKTRYKFILILGWITQYITISGTHIQEPLSFVIKFVLTIYQCFGISIIETRTLIFCLWSDNQVGKWRNIPFVNLLKYNCGNFDFTCLVLEG